MIIVLLLSEILTYATVFQLAVEFFSARKVSQAISKYKLQFPP